jgi:hypothetical protein
MLGKRAEPGRAATAPNKPRHLNGTSHPAGKHTRSPANHPKRTAKPHA